MNKRMASIFQNKRVLALIAVFALIAVLLVAWGGGGAPTTLPSTTTPLISVSPAPDEGASAALGQDLLAALALLRTLQLDTALFSDPAFRSLSDWGKDIPPQPVGRRNPFAPLGNQAPTTPTRTGAGKGATTTTGTAGAAAAPAAVAPIPDNEPVWDFSDIDFSF
jgi:hypothetical protein